MQYLFLKHRFFSIFFLIVACLFATHTAVAGERLDKIMTTKVLRVGTPGDYKPFAIKTMQGFEGHDIEVIEKMGKELGVQIEFVQSSWPTLMQDLADNKFDIAVGGITRTLARMQKNDMLPAYAPFAKVALVRIEDKDKFNSLESLNQPNVRVIKNPGGTNEAFVLKNLNQAQISTLDKNAEIPALIAEGKGDVMITETAEAIQYSKADKRLYAAFLDNPLTPYNYMGFMMPTNDADFTRVMNYIWNLLELRGELQNSENKWLH